LDVKNSVERVL
jgi:hypothetical protein